jgi:hypothetical protein
MNSPQPRPAIEVSVKAEYLPQIMTLHHGDVNGIASRE